MSSFPLFTPRSSGSSAGGGGSALIWRELALAPVLSYENNFAVYLYEWSLVQDLYTAVKVPSSYQLGSPIKIRILIYSPDSSGSILIRAQSTLIRAEVDPVDSTTNQRTTTNSAINLSAGTVNEPQRVDLDISATNGEINSVPISPGDIILCRLYRDTDTSTSDIRFLVESSEVSFA